jgi:putative ABC transport system permease protein
MIRHLFRLVWNRRKRHMLLMIEVLFSFLVLFYVNATLASYVSRYLKPLGFDYERVWKLNLGYYSAGMDIPEEQLKETLAQLELELNSHREIETFSWVQGCMPYGHSTWSSGLDIDGRSVNANITLADDRLADALGINLLEGRWFSSEDNAMEATPIVVNREMRKDLVGDSATVGRRFTTEHRDYTVVGVIDQYRFHGEFDVHKGMFFRRIRPFDSAGTMPDQALIRVRPGVTGRFEQLLLKNLEDIAPGWNLRIETLTDLRSSYIKDNLLGLLSIGSVAGFLVFNVALGMFGVLWYSINRRRAEIALRRALGAGRRGISWQILGEALVLATIALMAGLFIAMQVPLLGLYSAIGAFDYTIAMVLSAVAIYILVFICALYPSRLAMRIVPAQALRDE